jgi:hypothetical protein
MSTSTPLVLAIDQGTTGSTALLLDPSLRVLATHNVEFPNHYPQPGHVEHDPEEIWASVGQAVEGAVQRAGVERGADRGDRHHEPARDEPLLGPQDGPGAYTGRSCGKTGARRIVARRSKTRAKRAS